MVVVVVLLEAKAAVIARLGTLVQVNVNQRVAEGSSSCTSTEGASAPLYTKMHGEARAHREQLKRLLARCRAQRRQRARGRSSPPSHAATRPLTRRMGCSAMSSIAANGRGWKSSAVCSKRGPTMASVLWSALESACARCREAHEEEGAARADEERAREVSWEGLTEGPDSSSR